MVIKNNTPAKTTLSSLPKSTAVKSPSKVAKTSNPATAKTSPTKTSKSFSTKPVAKPSAKGNKSASKAYVVFILVQICCLRFFWHQSIPEVIDMDNSVLESDENPKKPLTGKLCNTDKKVSKP